MCLTFYLVIMEISTDEFNDIDRLVQSCASCRNLPFGRRHLWRESNKSSFWYKHKILKAAYQSMGIFFQKVCKHKGKYLGCICNNFCAVVMNVFTNTEQWFQCYGLLAGLQIGLICLWFQVWCNKIFTCSNSYFHFSSLIILLKFVFCTMSVNLFW